MKILMVALEVIPFVRRTSDVVTVVTGLSKALLKHGHDIRIAIPRYRTLVLDAPPRPIISEFDVPLGIYASKAGLWRLDYEGIPIYLVDNDFYFGREDPYGYLDDYERFIFFTRAVVEMLRNDKFAATEQWHPDVIHGHDWIAGFIPWWLRHTYKDFFSTHPTSFVYTIHNAGFPGQFGYRAITVAGLEELGIFESIGEQPSKISFLARGILGAHAVNTVSPSHAEEIKHEEYTSDLARALAVSQRPLHGILNGLDYVTYNPAFDDSITYKFDKDRTHLRKENKRLLQEECGLKVDPDIPLLGFINRLVSEKGVGLLEQILPALLTLNDHNIQVVIIGVVGDYRYLEVFRPLQEEHNKQFLSFFTSSLDDPLSHKLLGSADLMLIPSLREPCGRQQMLSMRYGAIPVVRRTGGLADTVTFWDTPDNADIGKGFIFNEPDAGSFLAAIQAALQIYSNNQEKWQEIQRHNMKVEFSWDKAARLYTTLYKEASRVNQEPLPLGIGPSERIRPNRWDQLIKTILEDEELAITADQSAYLTRVARTIRELLLGDAVLLWRWDERDPQRLRLEGYSFSGNKTSSTEPFNPDLYQSYAEQDRRSWQYVHRLSQENKETVSPLGFLESELARHHGWVIQLKVPIRTRGAFLGRIDIFTSDSSRDFNDEDKDLLSLFATSLAANFEKVLLSKGTSDLLKADRDITQGQTVDNVARSILRHAKKLTYANLAQLHFQAGQEVSRYTLNEQDQFSGSIVHLDSTSILTSATDKSVKNEGLDVLTTRQDSQLRVELTNEQGQYIGEMIIVKFQPLVFSHSDEVILQSLSLQAATFLQAAYMREKEDKRRVEQISKLADSLFGGVDFDTLLQKVLATIADVLQAKAASLYMINEETRLLEIRAADGYHKPLLKEKATYQLGEGTTGWIAQQGKTFLADSLAQLRDETPWKGKHKHLQGDIEPNAFLGIPLKVTDPLTPEQQTVIGVLKLEGRKDNTTFTTQDERLGEMMANVIATVIQNEHLSNRRLLDLNANLQTLVGAIVGGLEMSVLVQRIVETIAEVVGADTSSLYMIEPGSNLLKIQAAAGYQKGLVEEGALYPLKGRGITPWIAREGKLFKANSVAELQQHPQWAGRHGVEQGGREPNTFLGIPLKIITTGGREEVIGVLEVADIHPSPRHPEAYFTEQDQLLIEMMGDIIAAVVQNTRLSNTRLRELNTNLQTLAGAIVGGLEMPVLVQRIIDSLTRVLGADASSLYLIEPGSSQLKIQAATGYQTVLLEMRAAYRLQDPGLTTWIAREGKLIKANSVAELQQHPQWAGRHRVEQGGREPNTFLGIPLKIITTGGREEVIGVLKVEEIHPSPRHPEAYFTEQDQLLVEMMGNVITTVIQNTHESEIRQHNLKKVIVEYLNKVICSDKTREGIRSTNLVREMMAILMDILKPKSALEVLRPFMSSDDPTVVEALSHTLIGALAIKEQASLETQISALAEQTAVLLDSNPKPELFLSLDKHSKDELVKRWYATACELYQSNITEHSKILKALQLVAYWQEAKDIVGSTRSASFQYATKGLASAIAATVGEEAEPLDKNDEVGSWTGFKLPKIISSPDIRLPQEDLPILFFKSSRMPSQEDISSLRLRLQSLRDKGIGNIVSVVSFLPEEGAEQLSDSLRQTMKMLGVDSLFLTLRDIQRLVSAKDPRPLLIDWLLEQVNLLTVSPYTITGPTPSNMFFGREIELQEITRQISTKSYAIIGGRRIGKTSLLKYLHEISLPLVGIRSLYLDCSIILDLDAFMNLVIDSRQMSEHTLPGFPTTLHQLLDSPPHNKPLVLLLDETDKLIPADQKNSWPLFNILRSFINERKGQIVLGGERRLRRALQDPSGPLFNFAEEKLIGPLGRAAVERLVTWPMRNLRITLVEEKAIVDLFWESTGGHPNVVQRLCRRLIEFLNKQNTRQIRPDDVQLVAKGTNFLRDDFLSTYWEQASALERIILLHMVNTGAQSYSLSEIRDLLAPYNIPDNEVKEALDNLETLRSILRYDRTGYRFMINAFPQALACTLTIEDSLDTEIRMYLKTKEEAR